MKGRQGKGKGGGVQDRSSSESASGCRGGLPGQHRGRSQPDPCSQWPTRSHATVMRGMAMSRGGIGMA